VKKGDYVWLFLDRSRKVGADLGVGEKVNSRREWARIGVDDLLLVRGNLIIPHVSGLIRREGVMLMCDSIMTFITSLSIRLWVLVERDYLTIVMSHLLHRPRRTKLLRKNHTILFLNLPRRTHQNKPRRMQALSKVAMTIRPSRRSSTGGGMSGTSISFPLVYGRLSIQRRITRRRL
jgi:hypothetical protein